MALTEKPLLIDSVLAAEDLTKHRFVDVDGNHAAADEKAHGVCNAETKLGNYAPVMTHGIAIVEASGVVAKGAPVASDALGKAKAATNVSVTVPAGATPVTSDAAQPVLVVAGGVLPEALNGYAMDAAAADGDFIRVRLQ